MKLSKVEIVVVIVAVFAVVFIAGVFVGRNNSGEAYSVATQVKNLDQATGNVESASEKPQVAERESDKSAKPENEKININTADETSLETLPGIGKVLAQRIIDYREENGAFRLIDEIKDVSGIGEAVYKNIKDLITVE